MNVIFGTTMTLDSNTDRQLETSITSKGDQRRMKIISKESICNTYGLDTLKSTIFSSNSKTYFCKFEAIVSVDESSLYLLLASRLLAAVFESVDSSQVICGLKSLGLLLNGSNDHSS